MIRTKILFSLILAACISVFVAAVSEQSPLFEPAKSATFRLASVVRVGFANASNDNAPIAQAAHVARMNSRRVKWVADHDLPRTLSGGVGGGARDSLLHSHIKDAEFRVSLRAGKVALWSEHSSKKTSSFKPGNVFSLGHKDTVVPDHTDKDTVLNMGLMAFNSYYEPDGSDWVSIPGWDPSNEFGSSHFAIRGYIFKSVDLFQQEIVTVVIKGTSLQTPLGGKTGANDKLNDNLMFSCCCGKVGWSWRAVDGCGCANSGATECQSQCVQEASNYKESYYRLATTILEATLDMHPHATIWVAGHSLGGSLAALVALTFDYPAITFETPGDLLFAKRIGILPPAPPKFTRSGLDFIGMFNDGGDDDDWREFLDTLEIYQFGNDGDPIYMGTCTESVYSSCWLGGYAIETKCHIGKECVYRQDQQLTFEHINEYQQVVTPESSMLGTNINNHGIKYVIDTFLRDENRRVPVCSVNALKGGERCVDCGTWNWLP